MNTGLNQLKFGRTKSTSEKASGFTVPSSLSLDPVFDSTKNCKMSTDLLFWPVQYGLLRERTFLIGVDGGGGGWVDRGFRGEGRQPHAKTEFR